METAIKIWFSAIVAAIIIMFLVGLLVFAFISEFRQIQVESYLKENGWKYVRDIGWQKDGHIIYDKDIIDKSLKWLKEKYKKWLT